MHREQKGSGQSEQDAAQTLQAETGLSYRSRAGPFTSCDLADGFLITLREVTIEQILPGVLVPDANKLSGAAEVPSIDQSRRRRLDAMHGSPTHCMERGRGSHRLTARDQAGAVNGRHPIHRSWRKPAAVD